MNDVVKDTVRGIVKDLPEVAALGHNPSEASVNFAIERDYPTLHNLSPIYGVPLSSLLSKEEFAEIVREVLDGVEVADPVAEEPVAPVEVPAPEVHEEAPVPEAPHDEHETAE